MNLKAVWNNVKENGISGTFHIFLKRHKLQKYIDKIHYTIISAEDEVQYLWYELQNSIYRLRTLEKGNSTEFGKRSEVIESFCKVAESYGKKFGPKSAIDFYYDESVKEKTILLNGLGKSVRGNLFYILNELNFNPDFEGYKIYVYTGKDTDNLVNEFINLNNWTRTSTVYKGTDYDQLLACVQVIIAEANVSAIWMKKEGQLYINTWHGTPLKKLGLDKNSNVIHQDGRTQVDFIRADYFVCPNEYSEQNILSAYKVADLMKGQVVKLGYPRTGGMLAAAQSDQTALLKQLAPNGEKLYAYMPTWKDYLQHEEVIAETTEFLDYMEEHLSDDQLLYVNLHHRVSDCINYNDYKRIKQFPQTMDNYQVLAVTEALITDYSSVFYDYLALRRQIILYCSDYELYKKKRGLYMELSELPFDRANTPAKVMEALNKGKTYDDSTVYQYFCRYDSVDNTKKLCGLILGHTDGVEIDNIPKSGEKQVLIYSHEFEESTDTKRLKDFLKLKKDYKVYIGCEMSKVEENKKSAYPTFHKATPFGVIENFHLSCAGEVALAMYQEEEIPFEEAMKVLVYDYELLYKRMFDEAPFDMVVIYDLTDPEMLIALSLMPIKKKMFYLSDAAYEKLVEGDRFYRDALQFAMARVGQIYVNTVGKANLLKSVCKQKILLQKKSSAEDLDKLIKRYLNK